MALWHIIFCMLFNILMMVKADSNFTSYSNDSSVTEITLCENVSSLCYSQSTELVSELNPFTNEDEISAFYKKTTAAIDNSTIISPTKSPEISKKEIQKIIENDCSCDIMVNLICFNYIF